jgi:hypothetical protein
MVIIGGASMARRCYISFKTEDAQYKRHIQNELAVDMVDRSLDKPIQSTNDEYILRKIREEYLSDSTITIHLIGAYSAENRGADQQRYIKGELQASLYNGAGNTRNGILGVVLPDVLNAIYSGTYSCSVCGGSHNCVGLNDSTTVWEFWYNYYIPNGKCSHREEERYCVLVPWFDFVSAPNDYIEFAFAKRTHPIADRVRVRPPG